MFLTNLFTADIIKLTDEIGKLGLDAGQLVLSPTRTYAPVIKSILDDLRHEIHGMIHCTGGAQTKILHFVNDNCHVIKDNMFPVPPLSELYVKKVIRTGRKCIRYSTWDIGWRFMWITNMPTE